MIERRAYGGLALVTVLLCSEPGLTQEGEFPIGAWWPGLLGGTESSQWAARLDAVKAADFNTIHASLQGSQPPTVNQAWMREAHARGLRVQLLGWEVPEGWRDESQRFWSQTWQAESHHFTQATGTLLAGEGRYAKVGDGAGLLLDTPSTGPGFSLRSSRGAAPGKQQYTRHVFWLKTDNTTGTTSLATLKVLDHATGKTLISRPVLPSQLTPANVYKDIPVTYVIPRGGLKVRYQIEWTGVGNLWVDEVRASDRRAMQLFRGDFNMDIETTLKGYYNGVTDPPWRFYLYDEPRWTEVDESLAYMDELIKAQHGKKGVTAFNQAKYPDWMRHYVQTVQPPEFLVDFYPFGKATTVTNTTPPVSDPAYRAKVRGNLTSYKGWYGDARKVARGAGIPLWACVQAHDWGPRGNLRDVTAEEVRVQVNLALAHGATGIYYFMLASYTEAGGGGKQLNGLFDKNWKPSRKWDHGVKPLNAKLKALAPTYLALTSNHVFADDALADFVHALSATAGGTDDYFLGTFTHTDRSRYLMVVNERCAPGDTRTVTVTLDVDELKGRDAPTRCSTCTPRPRPRPPPWPTTWTG